MLWRRVTFLLGTLERELSLSERAFDRFPCMRHTDMDVVHVDSRLEGLGYGRRDPG